MKNFLFLKIAEIDMGGGGGQFWVEKNDSGHSSEGNFLRHISKTRRLKFCIRNVFMGLMTHEKFHFNWLMLTLIFYIRASEPPRPGERLKGPGLIWLM